MAWTAATPSTESRALARHVTRLFATDNAQGVCAGYSQSWLMLSLLGGAPLRQPGSIVQNPGLIAQVHRGQMGAQRGHRHIALGAASVTTLPESGLTIETGYPLTLAGTSWKQTHDRLATMPPGHYYLTMRNPSHAMACILFGGAVFYLEPQMGLFQVAPHALGDWAEEVYSQKFQVPVAGTGFKAYKVGLPAG